MELTACNDCLPLSCFVIVSFSPLFAVLQASSSRMCACVHVCVCLYDCCRVTATLICLINSWLLQCCRCCTSLLASNYLFRACDNVFSWKAPITNQGCSLDFGLNAGAKRLRTPLERFVGVSSAWFSVNLLQLLLTFTVVCVYTHTRSAYTR